MERPDPDRTLYVVDGTAWLFRAYYSPGMSLTAPDGTEVGAVLGLCQSFVRLFREHAPRHVVAVFDAGQHTFRNDLDPTYKANRGDPPDDLVPQFDLAQRAVRALGVPAFEAPGYEADDLMATLARGIERQGGQTVLVAVDKDLCQLVRPGVWMLDPKKNRWMDAGAVADRFGVPPAAFTDLQALVGDATDNIPGAKGVGPKTASALLRHFGRLEAVWERLDEVASVPVRGAKTLAKKLQASREAIERSHQLVTLLDDVPHAAVAALTLEAARWAGPADDADALFDRLGFHRPLRTLRGYSAGT